MPVQRGASSQASTLPGLISGAFAAKADMDAKAAADAFQKKQLQLQYLEKGIEDDPATGQPRFKTDVLKQKSLEQDTKKTNLEKDQSALEKGLMEQKVKKAQLPFEALPPEKQAMVKGMGESIQKLSNYKNLLDAGLSQVMDASQSQQQRLQSARQLVKTLNTAAVGNSDAVGQEEAKRLGTYLEYQIGNFKEPGLPMFGRAPISEFGTQVQNKINELNKTNKMNQGLIDEAYGRKKQHGLVEGGEQKRGILDNQKPSQASPPKAKRVNQDGHIFILNEQTGEYE